MSEDAELAQASILNLFKNYSLDDKLVFGEVYDLNQNGRDELYDYTGLISISGEFTGGLYLACKIEFLNSIYKKLTNEDLAPGTFTKRIFSDLIGELVNTMAGYFQKKYGDQFLISVPYIIMGKAEINIVKKKLNVNLGSCVVPFSYDNIKSIFVVNLDSVIK